MIRDISSAKFKDISRQLRFSLLGVCCNRIALVDESELVRTQMGTHNISKMATMHGTLCTIPPHKKNQ
jgi:hypothetical protein